MTWVLATHRFGPDGKAREGDNLLFPTKEDAVAEGRGQSLDSETGLTVYRQGPPYSTHPQPVAGELVVQPE